MKIACTILPHGADLPIPKHQSKGAAGLDLYAATDGQTIVIKPGKMTSIPTGIALELPVGYEGQIRPRSGLAKNHQVTVMNAPGTVDSDYRGELFVMLINHGPKEFWIVRGDRIAQLVIARYEQVELDESLDLSETARGDGGFGSTGR